MLQAPVLWPSAPAWMGFGRKFCRQDAAKPLPKKQHPPAGLCLELGGGQTVPAPSQGPRPCTGRTANVTLQGITAKKKPTLLNSP